MQNTLRLGIIGLGSIGFAHAKRILAGDCPEVTLTAAADRHEERLTQLAALSSSVRVFSSSDELMASGCCDAVLIAVPHFLHPELAEKAFAAGLHVLCEKPAGVYTAQVREMNEAADRSGKVFGMMFNQRTDCIYRRIRELVRGGELGQLKRISWIITNWYRTQAYYDSSSWRATWSGEGGGVLINQAAHQLDLLCWIFGMPRKVLAKCAEGQWHDIETEDDVTAFMEFENGASGVLTVSTGSFPGTNRLEIEMTGGTLLLERDELTLFRLHEDEREYCRTSRDAFGHIGYDVEKVETDGSNPQHAAVISAFADAVLHGGKLIADGREGLDAVMLGNAVYLSSWLGREVSIPFDEELFRSMLQKKMKHSKPKDVVSVTLDPEGTYGGSGKTK